MAKASTTNSLRDRILKNTTLKETSVLESSKFFQPKDFIKTSVPMINVALSGDVNGGLLPGVTTIAGPSRSFKTGFALLMGSSFLEKYKDGIILFYDSEFGSPQSYFETNGIDLERVVHCPITNVEEAKHDLMTQLDNLVDSDKVMIIFDSIGNLASKKEVDDAIDGKSVADFSRAKGLKSLFRMITPHLFMKNIPFVCINHTYQTMEMYAKTVVGGGTGSVYASDDIWILGRQQDKDGKDLLGYNFIINIEKSRTVREKSKIPITVSFGKGVHKWSGLFDIALELGVITSEKQGWYNVPGKDSAVRRGDVEDSALFWTQMFETTDLNERIKKRYQLVYKTDGEDHDPTTGEVIEDEVADA